MYASVPGHIVDCSEFICGIYIDIVISYNDKVVDCMVGFEVSQDRALLSTLSYTL